MDYSRWIEQSYKFFNGIKKIFIGNFFFLVLNLPLIAVILYFDSSHPVILGFVYFIVSLNLMPSYAILLRYIDYDISFIRAMLEFYKHHKKETLILSTIFSVVLMIVGVDIIYFKTKELSSLVAFFSGILIFIFFFWINVCKVLSIYQARWKDLFKIAIAYSKELFLSALTSMMLLFTLVMFGIYVWPYIFIVAFGLTATIINWFSKKAKEKMRFTIERDGISLY